MMTVILGIGIIIFIGILFIVFKASKTNNNDENKLDKNESNEYEYKLSVKKCPKCDTAVRKKAKKCPNCGYKFTKRTTSKPIIKLDGEKYCPNCGKMLDKADTKCTHCGNRKLEDSKYKNRKIVTKHITKNGLSFDCPDYYEIGNYPSSNQYHKSIVALSNKERICELYIMEYYPEHFDNKARFNSDLLKEYLKMQGYTYITKNTSINYCFTANKYSEIGKIKTTILFNFDNYNTIMIVGNIPSDAYYYNLIKDIKIINNSIKLL